MRKIMLFMLMIVLTSSASFAQKTAKKGAAKAKATAVKVETPKTPKITGPDMSFENTTVDFGNVEAGSDPFRVAKFTNNGTEPLIVKNATGSCGCTVPTWPQKPILPGESDEIKVRYDTNRVGPINKTVTITTNVEGQSYILSVKGTVKAKPTDASAPSGTQNMLNKG